MLEIDTLKVMLLFLFKKTRYLRILKSTLHESPLYERAYLAEVYYSSKCYQRYGARAFNARRPVSTADFF